MCNLITKIEAAEYKGKLYRSAKEAATVALQDVGAGIVQYGAANAGVKLLENGATLVSLLTTINPALLPATPEKADPENDQEGPAPEGPERKREYLREAIRTTMVSYEDRMQAFLKEHGFTSHAHVYAAATDAKVIEMLEALNRMTFQFGGASKSGTPKPTRHDKRTKVVEVLRAQSMHNVEGARRVAGILADHGFKDIAAVEACCIWDRTDKLYAYMLEEE